MQKTAQGEPWVCAFLVLCRCVDKNKWFGDDRDVLFL